MRHFFLFLVTFLLSSVSYNEESEIHTSNIKSEQDIKEMAKRPLVLQKSIILFCSFVEILPLFALFS